MAFSRSPRDLCAFGCLLLTSVACTRVRPVGTTMARVPALVQPTDAPAAQSQVQTESRSRTFGAVPRANTQPPQAAAKSSRVREAESGGRRGQPYVPRLEYDVRVPTGARVPPTGTAARTELPRLAITEAADTIQTSDFAVRFPAEMRANSAYTVTFAPKEDIQQRFRAALRERGISADQLVTRFDATLSSSDHAALEIMPERKTASEWAWKVVPRQTGNHTLNLNVTLTTTFAGESHAKTFPVISEAVVVTSPIPEQFEGITGAPWFWPAAIAALIAGIALSMALWRRSVA
jgi:hypothetical protein